MARKTRLEGTGTKKYRPPRDYTEAVLKRIIRLTKSPILFDKTLEKKYLRALELLQADRIPAYKAACEVGIIKSPEQAVRAIAKFIEWETDWTDIELKTKGLGFFQSFIRRELEGIAREVGFSGNIEELVEHLLWKYKKVFGWR